MTDLIERSRLVVVNDIGETWDFELTEGRKARRKAREVGGTLNRIDEDDDPEIVSDLPELDAMFRL